MTLQLHNAFWGYIFALAMVAVSILLRYALMPLVGPGYQYITVFPLIIVVAMLAGFGPAVIHALLAGILATILFSEVLNFHSAFIRALIVLLTGLLAGYLAQGLHTALDQARRRSDELVKSERSLRENQSFLTNILNTTPSMIFVKHWDGRFLLVNNALAKCYGAAAENIPGKTDADFNPNPDEVAHFRHDDQQVINTRQEKFIPEEPVTCADGTTRWFMTIKVPLVESDGTCTSVLGVATDITSRKQAEEATRQSELFYRQTLESIPGMVFTTRPDGYCDYQSSQWVEYSGVPMEQMLGDGWNKLLHPDDRPRAFAAWRAAVEELAPYDLEYRVRHHDGHYEWFKIHGRPIRDTSGRIVRWFGVAANINDLKNTQDNLARSEQRFRGTFENAAVGITHIDLKGNWLAANSRFCQMVGYTKEALVGTDFTILTHPDDIETDRQRYNDLITGRQNHYSVEKRYLRKDGSILWVTLFRAIQRDDSGKPLYTISVAIDITDRKRAEEQLFTYRDQLEKKNKELETVISIVSHDLRAPLVNVRGFASELHRDTHSLQDIISAASIEPHAKKQVESLLRQDIPQSVKFIQSSAEAMTNLVTTLVEVARAGLAPVKPENLDMDQLIAKALESIKIKFTSADVAYDIEQLPPCFADPTQVAQVFTNLLDNAVKYLDPARHGQICVGGILKAGMAHYWVADNGIGMALADQDKIFEPYYQLKEKAAGGVGVGLAAVKRMIDRNNGKIWVYSEKNKGSTFYVALPLTGSVENIDAQNTV